MLLPMSRAPLLAALASALAFAPPAARPEGPQGGPEQAAPGRSAPGLAPLLADLDASYAKRDDPAQLARHKETLAEAEKMAPGDYEVLWRAARLQFWLA